MKRRILSIITALALCLSLCPTWAFAVEGEPDTGLCDHHPEHIDCGYIAPTEGHDCGHRHTAECYTLGVLPDADSGDPYEVGADTENLLDCQHSHDSECGYVQADPGTPCGYECRICPIEDLIAALPEQVTEDNRADVRAQLDHILDLYRELNEDEQGQLDLSRIYALQGALDAANAPVQAAEEVTINNNTVKTLTAEDGGCQGHTFTGTAQRARIYVESGAHDVTFSDLNITESAQVGVAPGATMNLTIKGTNTISAATNCAGIYVPVDAALTIDGAGSLDVSGSGDGAGIGGAVYAPDESGSDGNPNCGTVEINGGTVTATGGSTAAGIGGGIDTEGNPGNGGNVTINSGTVTATGGRDQNGYFGGAGIGGGSGDTAGGSGGTLTINGGHVTLTAGNSTSYGFGQGTGSAPAGTCELTLTDASYLESSTTLDPKGKYTINGDPTADMIVVSEDLIYNGKVQELDGKIYIDDSKTGTGTYFGQTFTVNASAEGWVLQDLGEVVEAGEYTAVFKKGDKEISKTFTVAQSGTQFVGDGEVKTYNGDTLTTSFSAGDTITVKATPTPTGAAPQKAAARLRADPTEGQMVVYVGTTQVSVPADKGEDGSYTMEVSAADVLLAANGLGTGITLTAKFVENDNMADGTGTATVNITAVAKAELDGKVIGYYGESNLDKAFANDGATVTLLDNITTSMHVGVDTGNLTLDLNGKTITKPASYGLYVSGSGHLTIRGNGKVICTGTSGHYPEAITSLGGTLTLESGTFIGIMYGVHVRGETSVLSVTGESVSIQCEGCGLYISQAQSVELSTGTYSSVSVGSSNTLADLLAENCAYYSGSTPILLSELEGQKELAGPVTVKPCTHIFGSWAVENGIINGKGGGILDPKGLATRAQTAQMLKNFIESQEDNA